MRYKVTQMLDIRNTANQTVSENNTKLKTVLKVKVQRKRRNEIQNPKINKMQRTAEDF